MLRPDKYRRKSGIDSAPMTRREEGAYREYVTDEQRSQRSEATRNYGGIYSDGALEYDS